MKGIKNVLLSDELWLILSVALSYFVARLQIESFFMYILSYYHIDILVSTIYICIYIYIIYI